MHCRDCRIVVFGKCKNGLIDSDCDYGNIDDVEFVSGAEVVEFDASGGGGGDVDGDSGGGGGGGSDDVDASGDDVDVVVGGTSLVTFILFTVNS